MKPAFFRLSFGLTGCYMPDSDFGVYEVTRRRELVSIIRDALAFYDLPSRLIREVRINRLFAHGKRHGFSSVHFSLDHKGHSLHFGGMTEDEYQAELQDA